MSARVAWIVAGMLAFGMVASTGASTVFEDPDLELTEDAAANHACPPKEPQRTACQCQHVTACVPISCRSSSRSALSVAC